MHPVAAPSLAPRPAAATVVFIRPSSYAGLIVPMIATTKGKFLGESEASSYFVTTLPPGEHVLFSWSEGTPALRATFAAGKTYFVEVAPKMGAFSARVQLLAIKPGRETWSKRAEWLRDCNPIAPDAVAGQAYLASRADDYREQVANALESLAGYSRPELDEHTIGPDDGLPITPRPPAATTAAPAAPAPRDVAPPAAPAAPPIPKGTPDSVFLRNGGRVRGTVMEDEPSGVSVRMLDGTTRKLRRAEVDHVEYGNP
jgi:hypothetical protein